MASAPGKKTTLTFGLVSCPVALYKTTGTEKDPKWDTAGPNGGVLRQREAPVTPTAVVESGSPLDEGADAAFARAVSEPPPAVIGHELVEDGSGEIVAPEQVRRGIRRGDGSFVDLTDGLEAIKERTKLEDMRVVDFIRVEEVRRERIVGAYYLAPDGPGAPKVVRLLHEAMRDCKRVGVVRWTKNSRQSVGVLVPHAATKSLMVVELVWAEDVREPVEKVSAPSLVEVTPEEVQVATELVEAMSNTRAQSLDVLTDDARALRRELIARAEAGEMFEVPQRPEPQKDADVIDMLRASLESPTALAAAAA